MLGLVTLGIDLPASAAIHGLTAGAIGTMILAMMTRATRGHAGRELSADRITSLIYVLGYAGGDHARCGRVRNGLDHATSGRLCRLWIAAFGGFVLAYGPMLLLSRRDR